MLQNAWNVFLKRPRFHKFSRGAGRGGWGVCPWTARKQVQAFSISAFFKAFATYLKPYWNPDTPQLHSQETILSKIKQKGHLNCSITQPAKTDLSPCSLPLGDVSWKGTSATQWQKLQTDDIKSVWNLVINTDWMTEYLHSFSKDLQWNNQSQLIERDVPQFQGFAFVMNGGTCAMQRAMNVHLYNSFIEQQWKTGTEVKTWEDTQGLHCKYPGELHTIPYNFVIRNCMELSRRLFFISLGAADFVTYDQREVFFPTPFCQENVIIWKQTRHDRVGRLKPAKMKGFSSSISEVSFVLIWSK